METTINALIVVSIIIFLQWPMLFAGQKIVLKWQRQSALGN